MSLSNKNVSVGNGDYFLYTREKMIAKQTCSIMSQYKEKINEKEFIKKSIELFHLLTYMDVSENSQNVQKIRPNEPGDFLVTINNTEVLYELVTVFGDIESKGIIDLIRKILKIDDTKDVDTFAFQNMDLDKLEIIFRRMVREKKEKQYFVDYKQAVLLLITTEHDRCGTSPWYLIKDFEKDINEFIVETQSSIKIMNYYSDGKAGDPETGDLQKQLELYNKTFSSDKE